MQGLQSLGSHDVAPPAPPVALPPPLPTHSEPVSSYPGQHSYVHASPVQVGSEFGGGSGQGAQRWSSSEHPTKGAGSMQTPPQHFSPGVQAAQGSPASVLVAPVPPVSPVPLVPPAPAAPPAPPAEFGPPAPLAPLVAAEPSAAGEPPACAEPSCARAASTAVPPAVPPAPALPSCAGFGTYSPSSPNRSRQPTAHTPTRARAGEARPATSRWGAVRRRGMCEAGNTPDLPWVPM